jgi:hypothetical protein
VVQKSSGNVVHSGAAETEAAARGEAEKAIEALADQGERETP